MDVLAAGSPLADERKTTAEDSRIWDFPLHNDPLPRKKKTNYIIFIVAVGLFLGGLLRYSIENSKFRQLPFLLVVAALGIFTAVIDSKWRDLRLIHIVDLDAVLYITALVYMIVFYMAIHVDIRTTRKRYVLMGWELVLGGVANYFVSLGLISFVIIGIFHWNVQCAFSFANVICATDCIIIMPMLTGVGSTKAIGSYLFQEATLNNVLSLITLDIFQEYDKYKGYTGFVYFIKVFVITPVAGYLLSVTTIKLCKWFYNDYLSEMAVIISSILVGYAIANYMLEVSGSLLTFTLGLFIQFNRACFSTRVLPSIFLTSELISNAGLCLLSFIGSAQTTIYMLKNHKPMELVSQIVSIYFILMVVRAATSMMTFPLLNKVGLNFDWRKAMVVIWAGIRVPVNLVFAMVLLQDRKKSPYFSLEPSDCAERALVWVLGISMITMMINATTIHKLMVILGILEYTEGRRAHLLEVVVKVERAIFTQKLSLLNDRFLADANWVIIDEMFTFDKSFLKDQDEFGNYNYAQMMTMCPECHYKHANSPTTKELYEMADDWRMLMLHQEGMSYLQQNSAGLLSASTAQDLYSCPQELMDIPGKYTCVETSMGEAISKTLRVDTAINLQNTKKKKKEAAVVADLNQMKSRRTTRVGADTKLSNISFVNDSSKNRHQLNMGNPKIYAEDSHQRIIIHHSMDLDWESDQEKPTLAYVKHSTNPNIDSAKTHGLSWNFQPVQSTNKVNMGESPPTLKRESGSTDSDNSKFTADFQESKRAITISQKESVEEKRKTKNEMSGLGGPTINPRAKLCVWKMVHSLAFEIIIIILIFLNMCELVVEEVLRQEDAKNYCSPVFFIYIEVVFSSLFSLEFIFRIAADRSNYLPRSTWGLFDFAILLMGLTSLGQILHNRRWEGTAACELVRQQIEQNSKAQSHYSTVYLRILRLFRIIRVARFFLGDKADCVRRSRDNQTYTAHEIAASLAMAMEEIGDHMDCDYEDIQVNELKVISTCNRARIKANQFIAHRYICSLSFLDPGINVSMQTRQASASVVQRLNDRVKTLHSRGLLEDDDLTLFLNILNRKRYLIRELPSRLEIPAARKILRNVPWLHKDKMAQRYMVHESELLHFEKGAVINKHGDDYSGIYIITNGFVLVKGEASLLRAIYERTGECPLAEGCEIFENDGSWSEELPATFLRQLSRLKDKVMTEWEGAVSDSCEQMRSVEFQFRSCGFVVNEINMVLPSISICQVVCATPVTAYYMKAHRVQNFLNRFSHRFENLESRIWHNLIMCYYSLRKESIDFKTLERGFVVYINRQKTKPGSPSTSSVGSVIFNVDYMNMQRVILLDGSLRSFLKGTKRLGLDFYGPCEIPQEEDSLEFPLPSGGHQHRDEIVGKIFIIPHSNDSSKSQKGVTLNDIKLEAERMLNDPQNEHLDVDELLQRSLDRCSGVDEGQHVESSLLSATKHRIQQVIRGCFVNEGEVMTEKGVILNEGCLVVEGEQDEQKKMKTQLEKIDALLQIPFEGDGLEDRQTAKAKTRIVGIS